MKIADPHAARSPIYARWTVRWLNDPRDSELVGLIGQCLAMCAFALTLFFMPHWVWYAAPLYWVLLVAGLLDRFTLMLHCTSHRPLFKPHYRALNLIVPCLLGPFFGQTPHTYFAHHLGMHHREENLSDDLSSTMRFQRDSFKAWLRYWGRFMSLGIVELVQYMVQRRRYRLVRRIVVGEAAYWSLLLLLLYLQPAVTFVVLIIPLLLVRTLMMIGNWAQHAFIGAARPDNPYIASITCINSRYNRRCFNDGYHIGHHLHPRAHWTEYPGEFEQNLEEYGRHDAIVFDGLDFFQVWVLLMVGSWSRLARAFVQLPGARPRSQAEIIQFLQERVHVLPPSAELSAAQYGQRRRPDVSAQYDVIEGDVRVRPSVTAP